MAGMTRSLYVTTLGTLPGWPVISRFAQETGHAPGYDGHLGRQKRDTATIQVTLSGLGEADGIPAPVGSAVIMDGVAHPNLRYRAVDRWMFFYVNLLGARMQIESLVAARGHVVPFPHRHPLLRRLVGWLPEDGDAHRTLAFGESHRLASDLLGLLTLTPEPEPDGGLVGRVLEIMSHSLDRNLGLSEIAGRVGISAEHLSRIFHRATGETPAAWYRRHRLERARELLRQSDLSVQEVARRCGYPTSAHFIASFRAVVGMTPGRWRTGA